jgi:hypothetical protein
VRPDHGARRVCYGKPQNRPNIPPPPNGSPLRE